MSKVASKKRMIRRSPPPKKEEPKKPDKIKKSLQVEKKAKVGEVKPEVVFEEDAKPKEEVIVSSVVNNEKYSIGLVGNDPIVKQFAGNLKLKNLKIQTVIRELIVRWGVENKVELK